MNDLIRPDTAASSIALGPKSEMSLTQRGEFYFSNASICFQDWQSYASRHSGDGRIDGLNWDLRNGPAATIHDVLTTR